MHVSTLKNDIRRSVAAVALACAALLLLLSLSGCVVVDDAAQEASDSVAQTVDELNRGIEGVGEDMQEMTDTLNGAFETVQDAEALFGEALGKGSRVEIYDARGEHVATVEDARAVATVASHPNSIQLVSSHPDGTVAYRFEFYQDETIKAGQDASDVQQLHVCTIETYESSDVVTLSIPALDFPVDLRCSSEFMESLRALAGQ